jgi:chromosome segregation ATPase
MFDRCDVYHCPRVKAFDQEREEAKIKQSVREEACEQWDVKIGDLESEIDDADSLIYDLRRKLDRLQSEIDKYIAFGTGGQQVLETLAE